MASKSISPIKKLLQTVNTIENVVGWVKKEHKKGKWSFLHISDGFTNDSIQVVLPKTVGRNIGIGSAITVEGKWTTSGGKQQSMELLAEECKVWSKDEGNLNVTSPEQIRSQLHLRAKYPGYASLLKTRSKLTVLTHQYFTEQNYIHIDTPLISSNDCEGAGEAFIIKAANDDDFFGDNEKYLPVSGQLHLEAMTSVFPKVYTLNAAFRAEKSLSRQHLAEFRMLEAEIGFINDVAVLCDEVERYVRFVANTVNVENEECLANFRDEHTFNHGLLLREMAKTNKNFPILHYNEARDLLEKHGEMVTNGFNKSQELKLVELCNSPVFVINYPSSQKPFYMKRTENEKEALCFDLIAPIVGELAGGSLRENDLDKMRSRMDLPSLEWYYDLRKKGTPQTGGFGVGFERLLQTVLGVANIKDMVKQKHRYFLVENISNNLDEINRAATAKEILQVVKELYGDVGIGSMSNDLMKKDIKAPMGMFLYRTTVETSSMFETALPFVRIVGGKRVEFRLLRKSSTIRSLYLYAWEEHQKRLYAIAGADAENMQILRDISLTTGERVPRQKHKRIWK